MRISELSNEKLTNAIEATKKEIASCKAAGYSDRMASDYLRRAKKELKNRKTTITMKPAIFC